MEYSSKTRVKEEDNDESGIIKEERKGLLCGASVEKLEEMKLNILQLCPICEILV